MDVSMSGTKKRKRGVITSTRKKPRLSLTKVNAKVNRLIRAQDKKHFDIAIKGDQTANPPQFPATGRATVLNAIPQGDGASNRDGNRAFMESVLLRYHLRLSDPTLGTYRVLVVWDHSVDSGVAAGKYLDFTAVDPGNEALAPLSMGEGAEFRVLYDDTNGLGGHRQVVAGADGSEITDVQVKRYIRIGEQARWFNDAATNPTSGGIVLVTVGNTFIGPTATPIHAWAFSSRVRYTD